MSNSNVFFFRERNLKCPKNKVKALGVRFSNNPQILISLNLLEKLEKVKRCLDSWSLRRLSLVGKIVVLNSLAASQLVYTVRPDLTAVRNRLKAVEHFHSQTLWFNSLFEVGNKSIFIKNGLLMEL